MYPDNTLTRQAGAGLPVALFLITVLALIVAGIAQLQESSGRSVSLQIQSQRAFLAAESGAQVGVARVLANPATPACFTNSISVGFSQAGLAGCRATVTCGTPGGGVFEVVSAGQCGSGQDQAARTVEVRLR